MTHDPEVIIERVRKLIALTASSNVAEAALAADRAQALLLKYNLEMADVVQPPEHTKIIMDTELGTDEVPWRRTIAAAVAQLFFGRYFYTTVQGAHGQCVDRHVFLGTKVNTASAKMMFQYLCEATHRLARDHAMKSENPDNVNAAYHSFAGGVARNLNSRIMSKVREQKSIDPIAAAPTATALIVRTMHEQAQTLLDNWVTENLGSKALTVRSQATPRDEAAFAAGRKAGEGISLARQISEHNEKTLTVGTRTFGSRFRADDNA